MIETTKVSEYHTVWFDPGLTTGIAWCDITGEFSSTQLDFIGTGRWLEGHLRNRAPSIAVGWEQYIVTSGGGRSGTPGPSLETIGMIRWLCNWHRVKVLPPQPASARKLGDDGKLKRIGWWNPGHRHANDAANHLLADCLRRHRLPGTLRDRLFTTD